MIKNFLVKNTNKVLVFNFLLFYIKYPINKMMSEEGYRVRCRENESEEIAVPIKDH